MGTRWSSYIALAILRLWSWIVWDAPRYLWCIPDASNGPDWPGTVLIRPAWVLISLYAGARWTLVGRVLSRLRRRGGMAGVVGRFGRFIGGVDGSASIFGASPRDSRPALLVAPSSPLARPSRLLPSALLWLPRPRSTGFACPPSALLSLPVLAALLYGHSVVLPLNWDCVPSHCTLAGPPAVLGALMRWSRRQRSRSMADGLAPPRAACPGAVWRASTWVLDDSLWDSRAAVRCAAVPFVHAGGPFCSRAASFAAPPCTSGAAPSLCALMLPLVTSLSCSPTFEIGGVALEATGGGPVLDMLGPLLR
ncbi:hypothetical protein BU15DRAFT_78595 [Melanogaster broomeanus]|nr:hypothetical protein BU15DRAFT_78595 [Melanogaster broomeanus]